jgi:hypothetical protein
MRYKRHFDYEVRWAGEYYTFKYLQDARRFLRNKTNWTIFKHVYNCGRLVESTWIEESI